MIIDCCVILITIIFPPAGVFLLTGCGADLCINICLTCLGYFPGHIHAFYIMMIRGDRPVYTQQQSTDYGGYPQQQQYAPYQVPSPAPQGPSAAYYQPPPTQSNMTTKKSGTFSEPPPYN